MTVDDAATGSGWKITNSQPESEDGSLETQAGSHPFQLTTTLDLNQQAHLRQVVGGTELVPQEPANGLMKDLDIKLPEGLIGNPTVLPRCSALEFADQARAQRTRLWAWRWSLFNEPRSSPHDRICPPRFTTLNLRSGEPARFGFDVSHGLVYLDTSLRTGGDYGITVSVKNDISETSRVPVQRR